MVKNKFICSLNNWENVRKMYFDLRQGNYIHATPTLFNAGLVHHQMASCFKAGDENFDDRRCAEY